MIEFDASQLAVLGLDPRRHARVLGAPGTGKSRLVVESFARVAALPGYSDEQVLVLAPSRLVATRLRAALEERLGRAVGGTPVRTAASLAFAVLAREAAAAGQPAPRLLTGTVHDEAIARAVEGVSAAGQLGTGQLGAGQLAATRLLATFPQEVLASARFRAELREFWRVLDDFDLDPEAAAARFTAAQEAAVREAHTRAPEPEVLDRWRAVLGVIEAVQAEHRRQRPDEYSASGLLRAATRVLRAQDTAEATVPRLILLDDAQEVGEGELALIAACVARGSRVWAFGDPDLAAGAFHGERAALLGQLSTEFERRGARRVPGESEQQVVLGRVHRHGATLRALVTTLTARIGAAGGAGAGAQRAAEAAHGCSDPDGAAAPRSAAGAEGIVQFARTGSPAEQLGALAHRLRERHLGIDGQAPLNWSEMAVICRSRGEVARAARLLAERQIPTGVGAGGLLLREHRIVHELIAVLRDALELQPLSTAELSEMLGGHLGGLDPVAVRRLRGALVLEERRSARAEDRQPGAVDELLQEGFRFPGDRPLIDSAGGRALRRLGLIAAAGRRTHAAGGTAREVLWAIWEASGLAVRWQDEALSAVGARSAAAGSALDAVLALFFRLQRHEEQASEQPIAELLDELLTTAVPEDSLAARSAREEVTVTTPQGAMGREFSLVCVLGPQEGSWPNLRAQGSLLGVAALERWLLGGEALPPERRDTLHDELRLFALACSRARHELLVVSIADGDHHPGPFFGLGRHFEVEAPLPSSRLTLRGVVGEMRRRWVTDPNDLPARDSLAALAAAQVPGAHPDEWYGLLPPSTEAPLVDLAGDPEAVVRVSPSELERAEQCPLNWAVATLGGGDGGVTASLGTLLHRVLESADAGAEVETLFAEVVAEWGKLSFEAGWEGERTLRLAHAMVQGIADYLAGFAESGHTLRSTEASFGVQVGRAWLSGVADRVELTPRGEISILDLKTGRRPPTKAELEAHPQLQAYQLGVLLGAFGAEAGVEAGADAGASAGAGADAGADVSAEPANGGARLLYVHPEATKSRGYLELAQAPLDVDAQQALVERITEIAEVMAGASFTARVEHHCTDPYRPGNCRLHIIPAVSHA